MFNILTLFNFDDYFIKLKKGKKPYPIQLILDFNTNSIPFEILNDGKDFLSDYIIFSRILVDSKEHSNQDYLIDPDDNFTIVANPSEDEDIKKSIEEEVGSITDLIDSNFTLKGPYRNRNVNKIDLIRVMGEASLFHFSGHYTRSKNVVGWKLYNDIFGTENPFEYNVTENTEKVEIVTFFTGHGHSSTDENCAEFCNHQHEFTINGETMPLLEHLNAGVAYGCNDLVNVGVAPNQYGTWVYGRAGWCAGQDVALDRIDITELILPTVIILGTSIAMYYSLNKILYLFSFQIKHSFAQGYQ